SCTFRKIDSNTSEESAFFGTMATGVRLEFTKILASDYDVIKDIENLRYLNIGDIYYLDLKALFSYVKSPETLERLEILRCLELRNFSGSLRQLKNLHILNLAHVNIKELKRKDFPDSALAL